MMMLNSTGRPVQGDARQLLLSGDCVAAAAAVAMTMSQDEVQSALGGQADYMLYEKGGEIHFAAGSHATLTMTAQHIALRGPKGETQLSLGREPLAMVRAALSQLGGKGDWRAYGWAAFELSALLQGEAPSDPTAPLLHLMIPGHEIFLGHGTAILRVGDARLAEIWQQAMQAPIQPVPSDRMAVDLSKGAADYEIAAAAAIGAIDGDLFRKLILSREVAVASAVDMVATYRALRQANSPARSFLLRMGELCASGVSPGAIIEVKQGKHLSTQPLAGTRARGTNAVETAALRRSLLSDPKEIYEHALSVQLAQEEIGGVCIPESVAIRNFMQVVERGSVQHLASTLEGQLAPGQGIWEAFASVFPPVTTSGIPKRRAGQEIAAREASARGLYGGAVLMVDSTDNMDAALVIRSVFERRGRTWLRAGAGLIATSDAARELEETNEKLRSASGHLVPHAGNPATKDVSSGRLVDELF